MPDLSVLINKIDQLPTIPSVIKRLVDLTADPDANIRDILQLIEKDHSLTAAIIRLCNSSYYGLTNPVSSINDAVVMLGFNTISNMCLTLGPSIYLKRKILIYGQTQTEFWRHSIAVASCCEQIADHSCKGMIEIAYTAGLLHDIGKLVLAELDKPVLDGISERVEAGEVLVEVEKEMLGRDHGSIGGKLARRWKFPDCLSEAIRYHHSPERAELNSELSELTWLGNLISKGSEVSPEIMSKYMLDEREIDRIVQTANGQVKDTEESLKEPGRVRS